MKALVLALLVVACDGCAPKTGPVPAPTGSTPPPVTADGGGGCAAACEDAHGRCAAPEVTVQDCVSFCRLAGEQLEAKSARCRALIVTCSLGCTP